MAKAELGTRRRCAGCSAAYYDLNKDPIVCPKCGAAFVVEQPKPTRAKKREPEPAKPAAPVAAKAKAKKKEDGDDSDDEIDDEVDDFLEDDIEDDDDSDVSDVVAGDGDEEET